MSEPARDTPAPPRLRCLEGAAAPPEIAVDLARLLRLPPLARERLWEVLGPSLSDPVPEGLGAQVGQFCIAVGASDAELARAVKACRFLIREAAVVDLSRAHFTEDLEALSDEAGDASALGAILLPRYDMAKAHVRREIVRATLGDHGKFIERVDWRVDTMNASNRGKALASRVVSLTLSYREGDRSRRITVQLLPESLRELRRMCDQILT